MNKRKLSYFKLVKNITKYFLTIPMLPVFVLIFGIGLVLNIGFSFVFSENFEGFKREVMRGLWGVDHIAFTFVEMYGWTSIYDERWVFDDEEYKEV